MENAGGKDFPLDKGKNESEVGAKKKFQEGKNGG